MTEPRERPLLEPPGRGGKAPPYSEPLRGASVDLVPLARAACATYLAEFPGDAERYGADAARGWCEHDTQWLLAWAIRDVERAAGGASFRRQVDWLRGVLAARAFPVEQLDRHLAIVLDALAAVHPDLRPELEPLRPAAPAVQHASDDR